MLVGLAACGGGNLSQTEATGSNTLPHVVPSTSATTNAANPVNSTQSAKPVPVTLTYTLPTSGRAGPARALSMQSLARRRPLYISTLNTLISITVTPIGGTPTTYGPSTCTTAAACTISFTTTPGPTTIAFTLTDGSGTVLSTFSTTTIVQPSTLNTLAFTANPVVSSVVLQLASTHVNAGTPANELLTVKAKDADGKTIIGNANYVDVNGNPVALSLNVINSQAGGRGTVTIQGPTYITAPGQATTYAYYDGNWLASSLISVSSSSSAVTSLTGVTLTTTPTVSTAYTVPGGNMQPTGIVAGPDGNIWFTEVGNFIERMTTTGTFTKFIVPSGHSSPDSLTVGPDGNLWFSEIDPGCNAFGSEANIGRITVSGNITEFPTPNGTGCDAYGVITFGAFGPDANFWYPEFNINSVAKMSTNGTVTEITLPGKPGAVAMGPDGNMWVAQKTGSRIWCVTTSGTSTQFTIPGGRGNVGGIVAGPDGNLWFTEESGNNIGRITPNGIISEFPIPTSSSIPLGIIVGPDGNLWFVDWNNNQIDQVTTNGVITPYNAPGKPQELTIGPDGNIWYTEDIVNKIAKFVY
jgi:streptogramin lyase